jgi:hypothetical protein
VAQSSLTVTAENPTPPSNLSFVGSTPPLDPTQPYADDGVPAFTATMASWNEPSGNRNVFAANTAAAGSGISIPAEGMGNETLFTQTYSSSIYAPIVLLMDGCGPPFSPNPNQNHASSLSPATNPTLTSIAPASSVHASAAVTLVATGVGFTQRSKIYVNGVAVPTTFTNSTTLTAANVATNPVAGTWPVTVQTGGVTTAAQTWTFT